MNKDIQELLPFYVNGSASKEEKKQVEAAIKNDPSLKAEIEFLEKLRDEVQGQSFENSPGELGLKRLQKAIADEKIKNDPIARAKSKIAPAQNLVWRAIAIAACVLLVLQTALTVPMGPGSGDLTAAGGHHAIQAEGRIVSVTFAPDAQEENIRALLLSVDANIVQGPSALGIYRISISKDHEAAIQKLQAHKNLIESVDYDAKGRRP